MAAAGWRKSGDCQGEDALVQESSPVRQGAWPQRGDAGGEAAAPDQLIFDLPQRPALGIQDFLVSAANAAAVSMIDRWPHWPDHVVLLLAPARAGKTHLANVWRLKSEAVAHQSLALKESDIEKSCGAILIEDLHAGIGDERVLFHLINLVREQRRSLLLTSRLAPAALPLSLPDLSSRLRAVPLVEIAPPDRQLEVEPHVIAYLARHMERSMQAAAAIVAALDRRALATHRRITRPLAAEILTTGR
jgi:chromosomal replication initiation ATPase DnaA